MPYPTETIFSLTLKPKIQALPFTSIRKSLLLSGGSSISQRAEGRDESQAYVNW
ncbi:hypothetical protein RHEC894_CH02237 [Rhizobium sp. CIAT894]|nr:hypothetical protein RHEC894_CH02237 [Rhizobium sp. CIAT894]